MIYFDTLIPDHCASLWSCRSWSVLSVRF